MCLIAYVPAGKSLTRETFDHAYSVNSDGVGVMSIKGVQKFFGEKALKRSRRYVAELVEEKIEHAVHFRFATHGDRSLELCHPFKLPNVEAYLMHNGVIGETANKATKTESDTLLYVKQLIDAPDYSDPKRDITYWNDICKDIGTHNKGVVMYPGLGFVLLNKDWGYEHEGIWYSNRYSLPESVRGKDRGYVPQRLQPRTYYPQTGSYYDTGAGSMYYNGPHGTIHWNNQRNAYGFWQGAVFRKVNIEVVAIEDNDSTPQRPLLPAPSTSTVPVPATTVTVVKTETGTTQVSATNTDAPVAAVHDSLLCDRCQRPKRPTAYRVACFCDPKETAAFIAKQAVKVAAQEAAESGKAAGPSGPTLDTTTGLITDPDDGPAAIAKSHEGMCEHGETSWENCRECINRLEQCDDSCRLPIDNGGRTDTHDSRIVLLDDYRNKVSEK